MQRTQNIRRLALLLLLHAWVLVQAAPCTIADPIQTQLFSGGFAELANLQETPAPTDRSTGASATYLGGTEVLVTVSLIHPFPAGQGPVRANGPQPVRPPIDDVGLRIDVTSDDQRDLAMACVLVVEVGKNDQWIIRLSSRQFAHRFNVLVTPTHPFPAGTTINIHAETQIERAAALFPPVCRDIGSAALRDQFTLRPIAKTILDKHGTCSQRLHVVSADEIAVRFTQHGRPSGKTALAIGFKDPLHYLPFASLCQAEFVPTPANRTVHLLGGIHPSIPVLGSARRRLWAVDVTNPDCATMPGEVEVELFEVGAAAQLSRADERPATSVYGASAVVDDLRLACFSDAESFVALRAARRQLGAGAANKSYLEMSILKPDQPLVPEEVELVEQAAMHSLSTWYRACLLCGRRGLALIRVNQALFAPSILVEELAGTPVAGMSVPQAIPNQMDQVIGRWDENVTAALGGRVPAFLRLNPTDIGRLCKSALLAELLGPDARCIDGMPTTTLAAAKLKIVLKPEFTSCDSNIDTIACEQFGSMIELNVRDYSFGLLDTTKKPIGNGKRFVPLDLVLSHEVGHWLGIGHLHGDGSLMASSLERSRCVNNADIEALIKINTGEAPMLPRTSTFTYR